MKLQKVQIHPVVSEICVPQSLDPICAKFDKFLAHGQAHMGQMGKWPWQCTTTGLDNSTELQTVKIHQAVTEIWVPQVWRPPTRPPARPPGPWRQYPSSPEGWGVKWTGLRLKMKLKIKVNQAQNQRDLNSAKMHFWSKFGNTDFNWWWLIARTNSHAQNGVNFDYKV